MMEAAGYNNNNNNNNNNDNDNDNGGMKEEKEEQKVMKQRGGSVLGKKTILKSDHFPGCQNHRLLPPHIHGAPNYRKADSLHVHGVAIPTVDGIRNVLNFINAKTSQVLWINLREEPVVYVNGRPFVLRDVERPFSNLEYTTKVRLEECRKKIYLVDSKGLIVKFPARYTPTFQEAMGT